MDHPPIDAGAAGRQRDDRLSNFDDVLLGHILSFLDVKEAARAAALSSRWRDVFAFVHTVSLELPERPVYACDKENPRDHPDLRPFVAVVTAALFSRSRRPAPAPAAVPLRALRVSTDEYLKKSTVDQWVSYALRHAAPGLELDLRFAPDPVCWGPDRLRFANDLAAAMDLPEPDRDRVGPPPPGSRSYSHRGHDVSVQPPSESTSHEDDAGSSEDEMPPGRRSWECYPRQYAVPRGLFSCATLRSLRLGSCRLSPPAAISLPSLQVLRLTSVSEDDGEDQEDDGEDQEDDVQRLVFACPRLAELTVESCSAVTVLCLLHNPHLRRLVLRFCLKLSTVAVDASELRSFEYVGDVQDNTFLNVLGPGGLFPSVTSCKIDICAPAATLKEDVAEKLGSFLQLFASTEHLHLGSTAMGSLFTDLEEFPTLRHLQINGYLPGIVSPADAIYAISSILDQAPNLEVLTLFFEPLPPGNCNYSWGGSEGDLLDLHQLHYDNYDTMDHVPEPDDVSQSVPSCLGSRLRKINLVHYQGGRVQRMLARFLLGNALVLEMLYCGFAEGPQWIQKELMREIEGWVKNETAVKEFH